MPTTKPILRAWEVTNLKTGKVYRVGRVIDRGPAAHPDTRYFYIKKITIWDTGIQAHGFFIGERVAMATHKHLEAGRHGCKESLGIGLREDCKWEAIP